MVYPPEPCKELRRRAQIFMAGIVPYLHLPESVLIVTHMKTNVGLGGQPIPVE